MDYFQKLADFGLSGAVIAILFFICYKLGNKILDQNAKEREQWGKTIENTISQHNKEREMWNGTINDLRQSILLTNERMTEAMNEQRRAVNFARDEHKQMIEILGRINGYREHQ